MMIFRRRKSQPSTEEIACDLIRKSDLFDSSWYLEKYPDVRQAGFDPVLHYVRHGARERRKPGPWFDTDRYLELVERRAEIDNPLLHYLQNRHAVGLQDDLQKRDYSNFGDFLRFATLSPVVSAPFREEDKRCFAVMESIAKHLVQNLSGDEAATVSVIMPVRNRARTLQAAIDSVIAQNYKNFELIVVDDGSEDETARIAEAAALEDPRVRLIRLGYPSGVCAARNVGLAHAVGSIIAYLDSDNTWLEDYLGAAVGAFHVLPEADAIYGGQYVYADTDLNNLSAVRFAPMNISLLEHHNYIDLNCFLHRRNVIDEGVQFDEGLQRLVDWDFILKIKSIFRIISVPVVLSRYYLHAAENTITKTIALEPAVKGIESRHTRHHHARESRALEKRVCVIIPSYQALPFLRDCVDSLGCYLSQDLFELIIVDNNSTDEVKSYLRKIEGEKVKIIFNDVNYGFSYAVNQGVAAASADADIVLLNNDAQLETDSLAQLQKAAYEAVDIAMAVPRQVVPAEAADVKLHVPYAMAGVACDVSLSHHHKNIEMIDLFHDGRRVELNFAAFFCVYIKRTAWDACGGLDYENGRHYRSDRIMCDYVRQVLKLRIVYTPDAIVHHASQIATKELSQVDGNGQEYRTMLINNVWPADLMESLKIERRPWIVE